MIDNNFNSPDYLLNPTWNLMLSIVRDELGAFLRDDRFEEKVRLAFGNNIEIDRARSIIRDLSKQDSRALQYLIC